MIPDFIKTAFTFQDQLNIFDPYTITILLCLPAFLIVGTSENIAEAADDKESPQVVSSMNSLEYRYILVSEMTIAILLLVEAVIDTLSKMRQKAAEGCFINMSILMLLLISSTVIFFVSIPKNHYYDILVIYEMRVVLILGVVLVYAYHYGGHIWRSPYLFVGAVGGATGCLLQTYDPMNIAGIHFIGGIFQAIFTVILLFYCIRWFKFIIETSKLRILTANEWNCVYNRLSASRLTRSVEMLNNPLSTSHHDKRVYITTKTNIEINGSGESTSINTNIINNTNNNASNNGIHEVEYNNENTTIVRQKSNEIHIARDVSVSRSSAN
eukprot:gene12689-26721_t